MRRVHGFGVSCVIRGVSGTLADSQIPKFRTEMQPLVGLGMRRIEFSGHTPNVGPAAAGRKEILIETGLRRLTERTQQLQHGLTPFYPNIRGLAETTPPISLTQFQPTGTRRVHNLGGNNGWDIGRMLRVRARHA